VTHGGTAIGFRAQHFADNIPLFSVEMIAHELAHVYQHATGRRLDIADAERDAEHLQQEWGFWCGPRRKASTTYAAHAIAAVFNAHKHAAEGSK